MDQSRAENVAQYYDAAVGDWPGELVFYRRLTEQLPEQARSLLEVACGTGRVALRLAQNGLDVVGVDRSPAFLQAARKKSAGLPSLRWVEGDMRTFELGQRFGLVIMPGHSFQFMLTPEDQLRCLDTLARHLAADGRLVLHLDHLNIGWLGELRSGKGGVFEPAGEVTNPQTGRPIRVMQAWSYEPATQTATFQSVREEIAADGQVIDRWEAEPMRLHCVFRFEMEHLLARAGFTVEALYGDFLSSPLTDESREMIWVVRRQPDQQRAANG